MFGSDSNWFHDTHVGRYALTHQGLVKRGLTRAIGAYEQMEPER